MTQGDKKAPRGELRLLALDALHRYAASGLVQPGDKLVHELASRLAEDDDAE